MPSAGLRRKRTEIFATTHMYGSIMKMSPSPGHPKIDVDATTDAEYPGLLPALVHPNASETGKAVIRQRNMHCRRVRHSPPGRPAHDRASPHYFLSGYTAKVAGTKTASPSRSPTFTPFGAPLPAPPAGEYPDCLHPSGPARRAGVVGQYGLTAVPMAPARACRWRPPARSSPLFSMDRWQSHLGRHTGLGLSIPTACPGVPPNSRSAYDLERPRRLRPPAANCRMFEKNFQQFEDTFLRLTAAAPDWGSAPSVSGLEGAAWFAGPRRR